MGIGSLRRHRADREQAAKAAVLAPPAVAVEALTDAELERLTAPSKPDAKPAKAGGRK